MPDNRIEKISAREILDSRANPTLEVEVTLRSGASARASVPSGASRGRYEAHERRDSHMERFGGLGVHTAMQAVNDEIAEALRGLDAEKQAVIDRTMIELDGTETKERLGANAILATSLAVARAAAEGIGVPLFRYLGGSAARELPVPMMNLINGGAHAKNSLDTQEFMIVPRGFRAYSEALRAGAEIFKTLGKILSSEGHSTAVGDEGGYAPNLESDEAAIELILRAIKESGYSTEQVQLALDVASSEWENGGTYLQRKSKRSFSAEELILHYEKLAKKYPIISIEDGLGEDDTRGWERLTKRLGGMMLVGDDLFVTNWERLKAGIASKLANTILIKPNQIGTLSETESVIRLAASCGYGYIISHRSGETSDDFIADLAVAHGAKYIKAGAPSRGERVAKYNRLLYIEKMLGCGALFRPEENA